PASIRRGIGYFCGSRAARGRSGGSLRADAPSGVGEVTGAFQLRNTGMHYGSSWVLRNVNLEFDAARLTSIVGPHRAGTSTLLGIMAGVRGGYQGECLFDGVEIRKWDRRQFARRVSFVPQMVRIEFPFTGGQVAMMGRAPHTPGFFESEQDVRAAEEAME